MSKPEVTPQERMETVAFWRRHESALRERNLCSEEALGWLDVCTQPDCIGYEQGQLRPGKLGQWDLYYLLIETLPQEELLIIAGLSAAEVAAAERDDRYGLDPSDPDYWDELDDIARLQDMSPEELDDQIAHLETLLS